MKLSKQILFIIPGFVACLLLLSYLIWGDLELFIKGGVVLPMQEQVVSKSALSPASRPVRIKIPSINVDSVVEYVGLTSDGTMDVPKERANVAWFNLGASPGENGNAVIAGHYGWENKKGSAFDNLYKLREGDKLYIENDKGETISFVVRESRRYEPKGDASDVFNSTDGKSHLNLITCEGVWDKSTQQYTKRLVVFTDREME